MKRVLLLEEDREGREVLGRILKKRGFSVVLAGNTTSALTALSNNMPFDLVIAGTTDKDRAEFLSDLRDQHPDLPVIFLTDYCAPESRLRGIVFGAFTMSRDLNFYINVRPILMSELDRIILVVLKRNQSRHLPVRFRAAA